MASGKFNTKDLFEAFSKFGNTKSNGEVITLKQAEKWMTQAGIIDNRMLSNADASVVYTKMKSPKGLTFDKFLIYLDMLAASKNLDARILRTKLDESGMPGAKANMGKELMTERVQIEQIMDTIMKKVTISQETSFEKVSECISEISHLGNELMSEAEHAIYDAAKKVQKQIEESTTNPKNVSVNEVAALNEAVESSLKKIKHFVNSSLSRAVTIENEFAQYSQRFSDDIIQSFEPLQSYPMKSYRVQCVNIPKEEAFLEEKVSKHAMNLDKCALKAVNELNNIKTNLSCRLPAEITKCVQSIHKSVRKM